MKKLFLFSIFVLNFISCSFASELSFQKIKDDISKQTNSSFSKNVAETALDGSESLIYNDIKITSCERKFSDKDTDCDDWYNSMICIICTIKLYIKNKSVMVLEVTLK